MPAPYISDVISAIRGLIQTEERKIQPCSCRVFTGIIHYYHQYFVYICLLIQQ